MKSGVDLGGVRVIDADRDQVIKEICSGPDGRPRLCFALHVGGLNVLKNDEYRTALEQSDLTYADGAAVVLLARMAGARNVERSATTDIGYEVLSEYARRLERPVRLAIIGGQPGLADAAGCVLALRLPILTVFTHHGYEEQWDDVLGGLAAARPDIVLVAMGVPAEAVWCSKYREHLPQCVVLTCGGWLGFIVGAERRAPRLFQSLSMEWVFRTIQRPSLAIRYGVGILSTVRIAVGIWSSRLRVRS
ncbi:MAG TPA: WecB/TagA/CpsF family glycosyltransferase [Acidimicrobiales bacterium]|nr:WecB/TagA/CpsF family glycosyltransferase [Acidimicrobiales bacterium]